MIAALPLFPAVVPELSIDAPVGRALYVLTLLALAVASIVAASKDAAAQAKVAEDVLTSVRAIETDLKLVRQELVKSKGTEDAPEVRAIDQHIAATHSAVVKLGDVFHIAGYAPRIIVRRPDGTVEHDSESDGDVNRN
jgi:hypothetical protein